MFCIVCGAKAEGLNYNALTCMSCRAFFRRNASRENELKCKFNDNCIIKLETRKHCSHCRLKKCLNVGMKKELIQTDDDKQLNKKDYLLKRIHSEDKEQETLNFINETFATLTESEIDDLRMIDHDMEQFRFETGIDPLFEDTLLIGSESPGNDSGYKSSNSSQIDGETSDCIRHCLEFKSSDQIEPSESEIIEQFWQTDNSPNEQMNQQQEIDCIKELVRAGMVLKNPYLRYRHFAFNENIESSNVVQHAFHRLIQMAKRLKWFNELDRIDQVILLRSRLIDMFAVRLVLMFNFDHCAFEFMDDHSKMTVLVPVKPLTVNHNPLNCIRNHDLMKTFRTDWKRDDIILNLLLVIILFNPSMDQHLQHISFTINEKKDIYTRLLQRYLQRKYVDQYEAEENFHSLLNYLNSILQIAEQIRDLFFDNPNYRNYSNSPLWNELLQLRKNVSD
ncbi:Ligand binding domain protein [Blomia tropicalis]|nr:Ligand binding domain protein [Blomia tropicalis]